jgi:8-oxo-dGTP pyrophosphatase MutT (NUDIX family)
MQGMTETKLSEAKIAAALLAHPPTGLGWNFDELSDVLKAEKLREAAVLIGLIPRPAGWMVLLTKRTEHMNAHAGQVAFPGGRVDANDVGHVAAALRETEEEVGISARHIRPIGFLERFATISNFVVTPVVAILSEHIAPKPQLSEVAAIFEVPLALFLDPAQCQFETRVYLGRTRKIPSFQYGEHRIWGATAAMMVNFCERLTLNPIR